jgi:very-short-patch-repair endonuclease
VRGFRHERLEITVPRDCNRRGANSLTIHSEPGGLPLEDITTVDGIPVTTPARTLFDLAAVGPEEVVERCLDDWLRRRFVSLSILERRLNDPNRNHPGALMLRRLVDTRARIGVTESDLETLFLKLLRDGELPIPMLQHVVQDGARFVGRVDFAYPDHRVAIEVDSFKHHDVRRSFDAERARGNDLLALGWLVLRITSKHIEGDPEGVKAWVRGALKGRLD